VSIQVPSVNLNVNAYNKSDASYLEIFQFKDQLNDSIFTTQIKISFRGTFVYALEQIEKIAFEAAEETINKNTGGFYKPSQFVYEFTQSNAFDADVIVEGGQNIMIIRTHDQLAGYEAAPTDCKNRIIQIDVFGPMKLVNKFAELVDAAFAHLKLSKVYWYYLSEGSCRQRTIMLEEPKKALDAFYPWMTEGIDAYQKRYLESDASILLLLGPPGTGKTSFTRSMIYNNKLTAVLTFDEAILAMDDFFINFLMNDEQDLLVIEDADLMITSREDHGNKLMSRILNISDGLIKVASKKIVFSANLTKYDSIDHALIRPGRCHDVLDFRKLTPEEAQNLADQAGIKHTLHPREEYTLAEIFEPEHHVDREFKSKRIGFF